MSQEIVPVSAQFQAQRVLRTTSGTTQIRHLGLDGKPGLVVAYLGTHMHMIDVQGDPEPDFLSDSIWTTVEIEWAASGMVTKAYLDEFITVLQFMGEESKHLEAHARSEDAAWKAKGGKG